MGVPFGVQFMLRPTVRFSLSPYTTRGRCCLWPHDEEGKPLVCAPHTAVLDYLLCGLR